MNLLATSETMTPISTKTPILRYHTPARVESGHRGCIVKATAPITVERERGREGEKKRERKRIKSEPPPWQ